MGYPHIISGFGEVFYLTAKKAFWSRSVARPNGFDFSPSRYGMGPSHVSCLTSHCIYPNAMSLIHLENIWKAYGSEPVLNGITWRIEPGDRTGLIGRNGCGKTTLFHLLTGRLLPDRGSVHRGRNLNVGYLAQDPSFKAETTVLNAILEGFQSLLDLQHRLQVLESQMASGQSDPSCLEAYGRLRDQYEGRGGYALEARAKAILYGLGFQEADLELQVRVLSGGQQNRLALAQLLAGEPDLMLLDEPSNHLDIAAIEWLENFLSNTTGAFVVISHDRYFLDRAVGRIVELADGLLEHYAGSYTFYLGEAERRKGRRQKAYREQQAAIAKTEDYIRRNIAGQKTKQAQSRRKALEKLERVDRPSEDRDIHLRFASGSRGGDRVLQVEGLKKSFPGRPLFDRFDLILWRGDRIGIVGPNGSGKTTLLKLLTQQILPDAGRVSPGRGVQTGYYEQTRQDLRPDLTVLEEVWSVTPQAPVTEVRNVLGAFLFSGDDADQKIGSLSGGEQSRVALAKLMRTRVNLLALDEPTNHLDISSRVVLEQALEKFDGTLLVVSHDRYFLDRLVNRLLVLENGNWRLIEGNYAAWQQQNLSPPVPPPVEPDDKTARKATYGEARRANREQERRKRRAQELEAEIAELEKEIEDLDREMSREELAAEWLQLQKISRERSRIQSQIDSCFAQWEAIEAEMATARTE